MSTLEKAYKKAGMAASKFTLAELVDEINGLFPRKRYQRITGQIQYNDYFLFLGVQVLDVHDLEIALDFCKKYRGVIQVKPFAGFSELIVRIPSR